MWRGEPLPEAFGRRDSSGGGSFSRRGGGGLRTGSDRKRDSFGAPEERWRDERSERSPVRRRSRSLSRSRSRSRSPPYRGRSRSPRRDWADRPARDFGRERREEARAQWPLHLAPASAEEGAVAQLAGCVLRSTPPVLDFWLALELGDSARVGEILETHAADVNEQGGPYGSTPLGWAAFAGDTELMASLLAHGADPNIAARKGSYPLHMATWNGDHGAAVEALLRAGARTDVRNRNGQTPLEQARWFDTLEREAPVEQVYELEAWRSRYSKPAAGRAATIKALEGAEGAVATAKDGDAGVREELEGAVEAAGALEPATTKDLEKSSEAVRADGGAKSTEGEEAAGEEAPWMDDESEAVDDDVDL